MKVVLDKKQIGSALDDLTGQIADRVGGGEVAFIGLMSRGEVVAQRLAAKYGERAGGEVDCGALDITLYRDDLNDPHGDSQPTVRATEISFDINDKMIVLVDDVLHTGRSVRAAMDALIAFGRPKAILLAVLVDRGLREFPIQADFLGAKIEADESETVEVNLVETDEKDQVILRK